MDEKVASIRHEEMLKASKDLQAAFEALIETMNTIKGRGYGKLHFSGQYDPEKMYALGEVVEYEGKVFVSLEELNKAPIGTKDYWYKLVESGSNGVDGKDGLTPELKIEDGFLRAYYEGLPPINVLELSILKGDQGDPGQDGLPGAKGDKGERGERGATGKQGPAGKAAKATDSKIELRVQGTMLQYRINSGEWRDLINIAQFVVSLGGGGGGGSPGGGGNWGEIGGDINDQEDLQQALDDRFSLSGNNADDIGEGDTNKFLTADERTAITEIPSKQDVSEKGQADGYAELDSSGLVPTAQLPSYVDDVVTAANFAALPVTGEVGKIYVTLDDNLTYRWNGSGYTEISASLALGETSATAYRGDRGKIAYDHSQATGDPHGVLSDAAYDASGWDGDTTHAPTKNAVRDALVGLAFSPDLYTFILDAGGNGDFTDLSDALAAMSSGDSLYVREGSYSESGGFTCALNNITITGEGRGAIFALTGNSNYTFSGVNVRIQNLRINMSSGSGRFQLTGNYANVLGCYINISVANILMFNFSGNYWAFNNNNVELSVNASNPRTIYFSGAGGQVTGNSFFVLRSSDDSTYGAVGINGTSIMFSGNAIEVAAGGSGPVLSSTGGNVVGNSIVVTTTNTSIGIEMNSSSGDNNVCSSNFVKNARYAIKTGSDTAVNGNRVESSAASARGIQVEGVRVAVNGNFVRGSANSDTGILIESGADSSSIVGNVVYNCVLGIDNNSSNSDNVAIVGNTFHSCTTNLNDSGVATVIQGNPLLPVTLAKDFRYMKNTSGGALAAGDLVVLKAVAAGDEVTTTTTPSDNLIFGMAIEAISNNAYGRIQTLGKTTLLKVDGTTDIAIGDFITHHNAAGIGKKAAVSVAGVTVGDLAIAIALEAYTSNDSNGVIDALIITPRRL